MIEKRGDVGAGGSGVKSVNNERAFVVGRDAFGDDASIVIEEGGGVLAEVARGLKKVAVLIPEANAVVLVVETEASDVSDESGVVDAEENDIDEMSGGVIGFEDVDLVIVHVRGMARDGRGGPQGFCKDRGFGTHGTASEDYGLIGIGEKCEPRCFNQFSV